MVLDKDCLVHQGIAHGKFAKHGKKYEAQAALCLSIESGKHKDSDRSIDLICGSKSDLDNVVKCITWVTGGLDVRQQHIEQLKAQQAKYVDILLKRTEAEQKRREQHTARLAAKARKLAERAIQAQARAHAEDRRNSAVGQAQMVMDARLIRQQSGLVNGSEQQIIGSAQPPRAPVAMTDKLVSKKQGSSSLKSRIASKIAGNYGPSVTGNARVLRSNSVAAPSGKTSMPAHPAYARTNTTASLATLNDRLPSVSASATTSTTSSPAGSLSSVSASDNQEQDEESLTIHLPRI